jgi:hypothetical protein
MAGSSAKTEVYYRWTDASGRVHLVSSLDAVPAADRPRVERLELGVRPPASVAERASAAATDGGSATWLLLAAGVGVALIILSRFLPHGLRWLAKLGAFALVAVLLGGLYLGALRRSTGSTDALLATPSAIIDDTKRAVEKINQRQKERDEELRRIQNEAH